MKYLSILTTLLFLTPALLVKAGEPGWSVNPSDYANNMTIIAQLNIGCVDANDTKNMVGAFVNGDCRGVAYTDVNAGGKLLAFLSVFSNASSGETIEFKVYQASEDKIYDAITTVEFVSNSSEGDPGNPFQIITGTSPLSLTLDDLTVNEGAELALVGTLSGNSGVQGETFTYSLISGTGGDDNALFMVDGDKLKSAVALDFETSSTPKKVLVKAENGGGCSVLQNFEITVLDVNEAPTNLTISSSTTNENEPVNTVVGSFSSTDQDGGNTFTYSLVSGSGSTDNGSFNISGSSLRVSAILDFETKSTYTIRVRTTDNNGLFLEKVFTIALNDVNDTPNDISLSAATVQENASANTEIGLLSTTDDDNGDVFSYSFVGGTGSSDNGLFSLDGNKISIRNSPNYEAKSNYSIRVRTTDNGGLSYEKAIAITVVDVNENPTNISISKSDINENVPVNSVVGSLVTSDPDNSGSHNYTLVSGAGSDDNATFNIVGNNLRIGVSPDFETKDSYKIRVRTTDNGGLFYEREFTVLINDLTYEGSDPQIILSTIWNFTYYFDQAIQEVNMLSYLDYPDPNQIEWSVVADELIVDINESGRLNIAKPEESWVGSDNICVTATSLVNNQNTASKCFSLTVYPTPINAIWVETVPDQIIENEAGFAVLDLNKFVNYTFPENLLLEKVSGNLSSVIKNLEVQVERLNNNWIGSETMWYRIYDQVNQRDTVFPVVYTALGPNSLQSFNSSSIIQAWPNPVKSDMVIVESPVADTFSLYGIGGKLIRTGQLSVGKNKLELNISPGIYYLTSSAGVIKLVRE